jgi:hypothetical protein
MTTSTITTTATRDLAATHREWGLPDDSAIRWLLEQGIADTTLTEPYPIGAARVLFHDGGTFDVDAGGQRALTFRATDCGEPVDLVAWQPRTGHLASWRGAAFCLGDVDQCFNPATWFDGDGLRLHRDPLDWLRAGRDGIVILKPKLCWAHLRNVPRVICADIEHGEAVKRWIKPPRPQTKILIETTSVDVDVNINMNIADGVAA